MPRPFNPLKVQPMGYPDPWVYFLDEYHREYHGRGKYGLNGGRFELASYKGHIVLRVNPKPGDEDAKAAARLGFRINGDAWLRGREFDELIALLREAKRVWLAELRVRIAVTKCKWCKNGLCKRHHAQARALCEKVAKLCGTKGAARGKRMKTARARAFGKK